MVLINLTKAKRQAEELVNNSREDTQKILSIASQPGTGTINNQIVGALKNSKLLPITSVKSVSIPSISNPNNWTVGKTKPVVSAKTTSAKPDVKAAAAQAAARRAAQAAALKNKTASKTQARKSGGLAQILPIPNSSKGLRAQIQPIGKGQPIAYVNGKPVYGGYIPSPVQNISII